MMGVKQDGRQYLASTGNKLMDIVNVTGGNVRNSHVDRPRSLPGGCSPVIQLLQDGMGSTS